MQEQGITRIGTGQAKDAAVQQPHARRDAVESKLLCFHCDHGTPRYARPAHEDKVGEGSRGEVGSETTKERSPHSTWAETCATRVRWRRV